MTKWTDEDVAAFLKVMDPADDSTGGGTASAVAGAMAAGLMGMVARVSIGKAGMEPESFYREIDGAAQGLTAALMAGGREDSEAFGAVMRAYTLPKCTEEEKAERSKQIRLAMVGATRVPVDNAARCLEVIRLGRRLEKAYNENAASDLAVGLSLARSGLEGCLANVEINLGSVKDEDARAELSARAGEIRTAYRDLEGERDG
jgi:formiminotetrahydrofolate cyclodeaminase